RAARARHGGSASTGNRNGCSVGCDRDRGRRERRTGLDADLRAQERLSPGHSFRQALRRPDRARGICRLRHQHGAPPFRRTRGAGLPKYGLFRGPGSPPTATTRMAVAWRIDRQSRRSRRRRIPFHAGSRAPPLWRNCPPVRRVPRGRVMTPLLWTLIVIQVAMGAFDTLYHHELTERLAWRPSQRHELQLHGIRNLLYAVLFLVLGWLEVHGIPAMIVIAVLVVEIVITLMDFVEEDLSRKLPASERINHALLALNYGAILALLLPVLMAWAGQTSGVKFVEYGLLSAFATASAVGVSVFGLRDLAASRRLASLHSTPAAELVSKLQGRQTVLVTGATGFIGSRLVAALTGAGHQVIALVRNPAKAAGLPIPITLITSLDQLPADIKVDAIVNLAGE